jgi:hypothetical protein
MSRVLVEKQVFFKMGDRLSCRKQMQTTGCEPVIVQPDDGGRAGAGIAVCGCLIE